MWVQCQLLLLALVLIPVFDFFWFGLRIKEFYLSEMSEVYDMTNMVVLRNRGLKLSLVDMAWGTVLCGSISAISYLLRAKEIL